MGVGDGQVALELGDGREHPVDHAAFGGGGVDALLQEPELDPALAEVILGFSTWRGAIVDLESMWWRGVQCPLGSGLLR